MRPALRGCVRDPRDRLLAAVADERSLPEHDEDPGSLRDGGPTGRAYKTNPPRGPAPAGRAPGLAHGQVPRPPPRRVGARWIVPAMRRLSVDRRSSASELAERVLALLERWRRALGTVSPEELDRESIEVGRALGSMQPSMAVFRGWSSSWSTEVLARGLGRRTAIGTWLRARRQELRGESRALSAELRQRLPPRARILSVSRSASVLCALLDLPPRRRPREVLALESLPGGEGRRLARDLRRGGIPARVIPDRSARAAVGSVDLVLVGADTVDPRGTLLHKVGTRGLAAAARKARVPFVVLAGRSKWTISRRTPPRSGLFDRTPRAWITEYWTDRGPWTPTPRSDRPRYARARARRRGRP